MPGRPVTEVVQQAAEAINKGNYRLAVEACQRVLGQFPEFAHAHLLLAEAQLEQGDLTAAERAFQETLRREPQSAAAYGGLAKIAEQRGELETALAYLQAAWENAPRDGALRDRVARLAERAYGPGGRLHLTRAALATLHAEAGRWSRAAAESAAVLEEHPTRADVRVRLAEALWRRGNDDAAATSARAVLEAEPLAVRALLILADIERRRGNQSQATTLIERAHAIDLDGVLAADLISISADSAEFFRPPAAPLLDEDAAPERVRIAPAPDFTAPSPPSRPRRDEAAAAPRVSANGRNGKAPFELGLMSQEEVEAARPAASAFEAFDEILQGIEGSGVAPFAFIDEHAPAPASNGLPPAPPVTDALATAAEAEPVDDAADDLSRLFSLASDEDILAARPAEDRPAGFTGLLNSLDELGLEPFVTDEAPETGALPALPTIPAEPKPTAASPVAPPAMPPAEAVEPAPQSPLDFAAELVAGWDEVDQEIERAIPSDLPAGYTDELLRLSETGLEPFNVADLPDDAPEAGWLNGHEIAPLEPERATPSISAPEAAEQEAAANLLFEWQAADREIEEAIPDELLRGFTQEFEELHATGLEPFTFEAPSSGSGLIDEDDLRAITEELGPAPEPPAATLDDAVMPEPTPAAVEPLVFEQATAAPVQNTTGTLRISAERLGLDETLFERARVAKAGLIAQGRISGNKWLPGSEQADLSLADLEQAIADDPSDTPARLRLAEALREAGDTRKALDQYRWLYHHNEANEDVIGDLERLAATGDRVAAGAQRLIGAIYRRAGKLAKSAQHYQTALELQLQLSAKEGS